MEKRFLSILAAAVIAFIGCGEENTGIHDPVEPDETGIPEIPADPQKENTSFTHRIMLLQHTGTYCPNCPKLMSSLKEVAEDKAYSDKYHHVAAHSYNQDGEGDAAYSTAAAIRSKIDQLHKDSADAGIAASTKISDGYLNVASRPRSQKRISTVSPYGSLKTISNRSRTEQRKSGNTYTTMQSERWQERPSTSASTVQRPGHCFREKRLTRHSA